MEDWQEWQIRADQVAAELGKDVDVLEHDFFSEPGTTNFRAFWPRFRELKERVRVAPAIKLDDKLSLERRLRGLGSKAYKAQEAAFGRSAERRTEILPTIEQVRIAAEAADDPKQLRALRRDLDGVRKSFDAESSLVSADRQSLWEAWRSTNQYVWDRLNELWGANETMLRDILASARQDVERGNSNAVRQQVRRFFEALKTHETRQEVANALKAEADTLRREAEEVEERKTAARTSVVAVSAGNPVEGWRNELERNREALVRLEEEAAQLERQVEAAGSILEQAMIRGTLVDKRRKITELERANRALEQRIGQTEEAPLIPTA